jgi:hypothetical protein
MNTTEWRQQMTDVTQNPDETPTEPDESTPEETPEETPEPGGGDTTPIEPDAGGEQI